MLFHSWEKAGLTLDLNILEISTRKMLCAKFNKDNKGITNIENSSFFILF